VGLIAREVEAAGIPTLCMTSALDITRAVNPPRAAFLDYPLGHTTGKPGDAANQKAIMIDALEAFERIANPGEIVTLRYRWDDDDWKRNAMMDGDTRLPRSDKAQYQFEADRATAERTGARGREGDECVVCADYSAARRGRE
jgi:D-proline reductase (dithiol) PrdB